jgi:quinol monooxygenase YgiN
MEQNMELFLFARLRARVGNERAVEEAIRAVRGPTRDEPGCLGYDAFHSVRDPLEFYIHSRWRDLDAFEQHVTLPHTMQFVAAVEPLLDHPLTVTLAERLS